MKRRDFMTIFAGAAAYPRLADAQQKTMPVIGWLHSLTADQSASVIAAFRDGLREAGYTEGQNVAIEYRWGDGQYDRLPLLAAGLVDQKVNAILTGGGSGSAIAAKKATATIPIVFTSVSDSIGDGLVASLARPGGNVTGISSVALQLTAKRLEMVSDLLPGGAKKFALLVNPDYVLTPRIISQMSDATANKDVVVHITNARNETELDSVFSALPRLQAEALIVGSDPFFYDRRQLVAALAARSAVPAIYELRQFADAGGLMSYGTSITGIYRQAAGYVGRILKGANPADFPVQQPTKFELVINLKTAKALALTVPRSLLQRADEVIE